MKKIIIIALSALCLQGCIGAAFVAGATAGGAVLYDRRGVETVYNDTETSHQIKLAIDNDEAFKGSHVIVATFNHIVLLAGEVSNQGLIQKAQTHARKNKNAQRVYNEIKIGKPLSPLASSKDAWITTKVKANMLAENGLKSAQIKVVTEDKTVYLMGLVTKSQATHAAKSASEVSGVKRVVKLFEYA